jgi:hypothetical protein
MEAANSVDKRKPFASLFLAFGTVGFAMTLHRQQKKYSFYGGRSGLIPILCSKPHEEAK